jgi:hypothetical protein
MTNTYLIRDPFAGEFDIEGETLEAAIAKFYADVPIDERPAYIWHGGEQVDVPGGTCRPIQ